MESALSRKKASTQGMRVAAAPPVQELARRVTGFTAACVLVSNVIGTGIFTTTGFLARDIGDPLRILALWVIGAVLALAGAVSYSELGAAMPDAGGEYVYIREAYGRIPGFLSGWMSFTIGFGAAIAAAAIGFASYFLALWGDAAGPAGASGMVGWLANTKTLALVALWGLTAVHAVGVGPGGGLQRVLTMAKVGAIAVLVVAGLSIGHGQWANLTRSIPAPFSLSTTAVSLIFITFAYSGWNAAGYIAGEIADPGRNVPRAMMWGTIFVTLVYLALNVVYFYALPVDQLQGTLAVAEKSSVALFGPPAARFVTALLCVSILSAASAMVWAGPRVYYAMARDGVFPAMFGEVCAATGVPTKATVLQSAWASILILTGTFEQLVVYAGFALALFSSIAVGSVVVLRRTRPDLPRPFRVRPFPLLPVIYIAISVAIMWYTLLGRPLESLLGVATAVAGLPVYYWCERRSAADHRARTALAACRAVGMGDQG